MEHTRSASTSQADDGKLLGTWKEGSRTLFATFDQIMSSRCFMMVADDGDVDFGAEVPQPVGIDEFPDQGPIFCVDAGDSALSELAGRSLISEACLIRWCIIPVYSTG